MQAHHPSLVFLCETRQHPDRVRNLRYRLGMKGCFAVKGDGKGGGLALFHHEDVEVNLLSYSKRHIDVHIQGGPFGARWRGTFVYGDPMPSERHHMWTLLRRIKNESTEPWLMLGDFNEAMWQDEHFSRSRRSERLMMDFREILSHCDVHDLGFFGVPWTFDNKQRGDRNVKVRLDRAVASPAWSQRFPEARVQHLVSSRSDHCPLLVMVATTCEDRRRPPCRRYEIMWEREPSLTATVEKAWLRHVGVKDLGDVCSALRSVMGSLYDWKREHFKPVSKELDKRRKKLEELMLCHDAASEAEKKQVLGEMDELLYREELMWLQRSRITWLCEGDRNTRYFHRKATWRHTKNKITRLRKEDGTWTENAEEIGHMASSFFQHLYTREDHVDPSELLILFTQRVDDEMNNKLCEPFSEKEISDALFQIGPLKAPGPDGFPARFIQRNWELLKEDVVSAVQAFFGEGVMPDGVNETAIVLIPKKNNPEELKDFRPISLCNVVFKIISKCLVNRLRPLLDDIISPMHSAFIPGRLITDNALMAFECIHAIQSNSADRSKFCAYKLDLAKAYDRVDWRFLEGAMANLGFHSKWIRWIMQCVTTVQYSVRLNGHALDTFTPTRGLSHGDPLSPYLFLLVADGLSRLI